MKAWKAKPKDEFHSTVVFADTRGKARQKAMHSSCCQDVDFINIEITRYKIADKMYKGRDEIEWEDPNDRLFLVKECGWSCEDVDISECEVCVGKDYCEKYQEFLENEEEYF